MAANPRLCPRCGGPLTPVSNRPGRWACQPCGLGFSVHGRKAAAPHAAGGGDTRLGMALLVAGGGAVVLLTLIAAITFVVLHPAGRAAAPKPVAVAPEPLAPPTAAPDPRPVALDPVLPTPPPAPNPPPAPLPGPGPRPALDPTPAPKPPVDAASSSPPAPAPDSPVNRAIDKGVAYLKRVVRGARLGPEQIWASQCQGTGTFSLVGLALLESGVPADDPAVVKAVAAVREGAAATDNTYEIATCLWLLNRVDDRRDDDLVRELAARLLAGQSEYGTWGYVCPTVAPAKQRELLAVLNAYDPSKEIPDEQQMVPVCAYRRGLSLRTEEKEQTNLFAILAGAAAASSNTGDNSVTQFAVLGLWVARKHQVPVDRSLLMAEAHARATQEDEGGWAYLHGRLIPPTDAMTCAGLMDLAVGRGVSELEGGKAREADPQFEKGIWYLSDIYDRGGAAAAAKASMKAPAAGDPYATLQPLAADLLGHALQGQRAAWKKDLAAFQAELERCLAAGPPAEAQKDMQQIADQIKLYRDAPGDKVTQEKAVLVKRIQQSPAGRAAAAAAAGAAGPGMGPGGLLFANPGLAMRPNNFLRPNRDQGANVDDIYALWSMERLAMVCDLKTLAGHDWYAWGADLLVSHQRGDGGWAGTIPEPVDTCLALLFLKRVNVAPDLTVQLQRIAPIQDLTADQLHYTSAGQFRLPSAAPPKP